MYFDSKASRIDLGGGTKWGQAPWPAHIAACSKQYVCVCVHTFDMPSLNPDHLTDMAERISRTLLGR